LKSLIILSGCCALLPAFAQHVHQVDAQRQAEVAARGREVMPFDLSATIHVFTKVRDGGTQRVLAKNNADAPQVKLVRAHLRDIARQFRRGDFMAPAHIHGNDMPGLAELRKAEPGQLTITYRDVPAGAELGYQSRDPELVAALHRWFDAQLSEHGADAAAGHHD